MSEEYYLLEDGEKKGPFAFNELIQRGIEIDTPVLLPGADEYQNASYLPEFMEYFDKQGYHFPTEDNLAGFGWRTLAFVIDYMVISIIAGFVCIKSGLLVVPPTGSFDPKAFFNTLPQHTVLMIEATVAIVFLIYNVLFEATGMRGSLGKRLCGLKVVDADGRRVNVGIAFLRNVGALTAYNPFGLIILIIIFFAGKYQQTWYERLLKTYMIKAE